MKTTSSWGLVLSCLVAVGCTQSPGPTLARPNTSNLRSQTQALGGVGLSTAASFDAPVIDANAQTPLTPGAGSFTVSGGPSGGPDSLGVIDASAAPAFHYVMVGDFSGAPQHFFAVVADVPFTLGTHAIDNVHVFAGVFDAHTGDPTHLATQGAVTFTTAGGLGGRWVGSFQGDLDEVAAAPGCRSSSDCAGGEVCSSGVCVSAPPPQCSSTNPCAAGQQCQGGVCVPVAPAGCVVDADCAPGQACASGQCAWVATTCRSDADCQQGESCQHGACLPTSPSQCSSHAQCPLGQVCQAGQCTPGGSSQCEGQQGDGAFSGQVGALASCAAVPSGAVTLQAGVAIIDDERRLVVFDPNVGDEGVVLELAVCPGAAGTLTLGNGLVSAAHIKDSQSAGLRLYAERAASSASLTLTRVAPSLAGSFSLTLQAGGAVSGTFDLY